MSQITDEQVEAIVKAVKPYTMTTLFVEELREIVKSALSAPLPPVDGEAVAWRVEHGGGATFWNVEDNARRNAGTTGGTVSPLFASPPLPDKENGDWKGANYLAEARKLMAEAKDRVKPIVGGPEGETIIAYEIPTGLWLMLQAHVRNLLDTLPPPVSTSLASQEAGE